MMVIKYLNAFKDIIIYTIIITMENVKVTIHAEIQELYSALRRLDEKLQDDKKEAVKNEQLQEKFYKEEKEKIYIAIKEKTYVAVEQLKRKIQRNEDVITIAETNRNAVNGLLDICILLKTNMDLGLHQKREIESKGYLDSDMFKKIYDENVKTFNVTECISIAEFRLRILKERLASYQKELDSYLNI